MKRKIALPVIAVSVILFACKDVSSPAIKSVDVAEPVAAGRAALATVASMKSIQTSALDAGTRLTASMKASPDVSALRAALIDLADFAAAGDRPEALASATSASLLLAKVDPAARNPDAAAIRLVINGAMTKLSQ